LANDTEMWDVKGSRQGIREKRRKEVKIMKA
jgi:hypothetical protein